MKIMSLLLAAGLTVAATGCATTRVSADWDRNASFASYQSYAWVDTPQMRAMERGTLFDRRLRAAVDEQLATKGYRRVASGDDADVLLLYHADVQERLDVQHSGYAGRQWDVRDYRRGTLVIDLVDARSRTLVWRGTAEAEIADPDRSGERIAKAVRSMFASLPEG